MNTCKQCRYWRAEKTIELKGITYGLCAFRANLADDHAFLVACTEKFSCVHFKKKDNG